MLNIPFSEAMRMLMGRTVLGVTVVDNLRLSIPAIPAGPSQRRVGPRLARSRYRPHQSDRECARRVRQMQRAAAKAADQARYDEVMRRLRAGARFER